MMDDSGFDSPIGLLSGYLVILTFAALGSGMAMLMPELQRFIVQEHGWMSNEDFIAAFTLAQAMPGPNFMYVTLLGYHIAGVKGALMTTLAVVVPTSTLCYAILRFGQSRVSPRFHKAMRDGLAPLSGGLMLAFGWVLCSHVDTNWRATLVTVAAVLIFLRSRINPLWLVLAGALLGVTGVVTD